MTLTSLSVRVDPGVFGLPGRPPWGARPPSPGPKTFTGTWDYNVSSTGPSYSPSGRERAKMGTER